MLKVEKISRFYSQRQAALHDISFQVNKGEMVFIAGASGAGKTTLLRLLYLDDKPTSGNIILDKYDYKNLAGSQIPKLRRRIGVVFQDFRLIPDRTVAENVALPLEVVGKSSKEIKRKTDESLKLVGLWPKKNSFPGQLSGGEIQRTAVARAIINDPLVLFADEPTGNLDEHNARALFDLFKSLNVLGATIVVSTHRLDLAMEYGRRILRLESGVLIDKGTI